MLEWHTNHTNKIWTDSEGLFVMRLLLQLNYQVPIFAETVTMSFFRKTKKKVQSDYYKDQKVFS